MSLLFLCKPDGPNLDAKVARCLPFSIYGIHAKSERHVDMCLLCLSELLFCFIINHKLAGSFKVQFYLLVVEKGL